MGESLEMIIKYPTRVYEPGGSIMIHRSPLRFHHVMHAWENLGTGGLRVCRYRGLHHGCQESFAH